MLQYVKCGEVFSNNYTKKIVKIQSVESVPDYPLPIIVVVLTDGTRWERKSFLSHHCLSSKDLYQGDRPSQSQRVTLMSKFDSFSRLDAKGKAIAVTVAVILVFAAAALLTVPVWLLWNWLMPMLFGLPSLTFLQAFGLCFLLNLLFGNRGGSSK